MQVNGLDYFLSCNTTCSSYTLTAQHDKIPLELSLRGTPDRDTTPGNYFGAYTFEQHDQTLVDSFGQLKEVRLPQLTGLYGCSKKANPSLPSSLTTAQDYLGTIVPDDVEIRPHGFTHNVVITPGWFAEGELERPFDPSFTIEQFPSFDMVPEPSNLSESPDLSERSHQFAEFNYPGPSLHVFVPIAEETPTIKALVHRSIRTTKSVGRVQFLRTKPPGLCSPLQEIDPSKGDFDRSRGIVADGDPEIEEQGILTDMVCNGRCKGDLVGDHECKYLQRKRYITCLSNNCMRTFKTKSDFNRHCKTRHSTKTKSLILYDCQFAGCSKTGKKGFSRKDNMLQHLRRVHKVDFPVKKWRFGTELTL
ncbi:uncharacterized protein H6S33_009969 [Morchella sextelata]|uniref:uncharacterized protein n=1 Tax=Morchella sextelata TaxID=1174677 RepID=UPI001D05A862|nr:uncharacterized protein H6S33_009969 [Morchella sextelata]KAH0611917.1 hypothetical protein H6S33_009969 [Morchella sextelata]